MPSSKKLSPRSVENLRTFAERYSEFQRHPLIREKKLRAPSPTLFLLQQTVGLNNITDGPIVDPDFERVDEMLLADFTRIIRFFHLKKEPSSIIAVTGSVRADGINSDLDEKFRQIEELFDKRRRGGL